MTNDELNKYIHIEIMGLCWHSFAHQGIYCDTCMVDTSLFTPDDWKLFRPDYCSDDSPRSLLRGVVAKLLAGDANGEIERALDRKMVFARSRNADPRWSCPYLATAEQIARACVEAHKTTRVSQKR